MRRGPSPARSGTVQRSWSSGPRTTTAATRPGCASRTPARTRSSAARRWCAELEPHKLPAMGSRLAVLAVSSFLLLAAAAPVQAADGDLDPTFGTAGQVVLDHGPGPGAEGAGTLLPLPDGSFLAVGSGDGHEPWISKSDANGALVPGYGNTPTGFALVLSVRSFAADGVLTPDGGVLAVGGTDEGLSFSSLALKLTPAGTLDPAFGNDAPNPTGDGLVRYDLGGEDIFYDAAMQGASAVVTGRIGPSASFDILVLRLKPDGSIDPAFGPPGHKIDLPGKHIGQKIAPTPDGGVVIATSGTDCPAVVKLPAAGQLDTSFGGGDGIAQPSTGNQAATESGDIILDSAGNLLVDTHYFAGFGRIPAGAGATDVGDPVGNQYLTRYLPNGTPHATFGTGGTVTIPPAGILNVVFGGLAIGDDGKIVASGDVRGPGIDASAVGRFLPDGTIDPAWGENGLRTYPVAGADFAGLGGIAMLPGRRILLSGETDTSTTSGRLLMRLNGDTTAPDTKISSGPKGKIGP